MNEVPPSADRLGRRHVLLAVVIVASAGALALDPINALVFGWFPFLARVLPRVTVDRPSLLVGSMAFLLFAAGVHGFGRANPRWRWRTTVAAVLAVVVLFAAGISLVGIAHNLTWLARSEQPLVGKVLPGDATLKGNLNTIWLTLGNYESALGYFPAAINPHQPDKLPISWATQIVPYIAMLPADIKFDLPWDAPVNAHAYKRVVPFFINPNYRPAYLYDAAGYGLNNFAANVNVMGGARRISPREITDGAANTFLLGEVNAEFRPWAHPVNARDPAKGINNAPQNFGGVPGAGGVHFMNCDGSIRFVSDKVGPAVLKALATPDAGD